MNQSNINYYKKCREGADLSQEQAAEMLHVSIRSLSDYENGKTIPSNDIVSDMVEVYHTKLLGLFHLRNSSELGRKFLPSVESIRSEADIFLKVIFSEDDILSIKEKTKKLLEDGKITLDEQNDFQKIQQQARDVIARLLSVVVYEPKF